MNLADILGFGRKFDCSDIHLTVNVSPYGRKNGVLLPTTFPELTSNVIFSLLEEILSKQEMEMFLKGSDIDTSYVDQYDRRYRVNAYRQQSNPCVAIRLLRESIPSMFDLRLPSVVENLANLPRGLILVTGPTGSGKSTTMAAMVDHINRSRQGHIITIEDPIEYVHRHQSCLIHQREVGRDVPDFASALRSALREDPDVILVGEMRDFETISAALTAAETGHLVISSLHTNSATSTIDRVIDVFPPHQQQQIRTQLASTLRGVITQQLLPKADGNGRVAAFEILVMTDSIAAMIRESKVHQIASSMQTGRMQGMQLMDMALGQLVMEGQVSVDQAVEKCTKIDLLKQYMR